MADDNSYWINRLNEGDPESFEKIWEQFFHELENHVRNKLRTMRTREFDEEDVALSAMHSVFRAFEGKRIPKLEDSQDLYKILFTFANRKISKQYRRNFAQKRGAGTVRGDSIFESVDGEVRCDLGDFGDGKVSHELVVAFQDELEFRLQEIDDCLTREIVLLKLEGLTNREVADRIGRVERTVERKLALLRENWNSNIT